ncbi:uncharacterized protein LOC116213934 [Punica granatum]|uniref:Uncharacterized protein n=2 Tax=Punica granatum TaxID=22663 RepID=A0A218WDU5_PUNGR|nr:uncharacterized protein LOC116213934 [Punica granatum]OWM70638.1 hypothetical protein CDL15_Pgr014311 [Punica granatum]PKI55185.1 hypothetical protein CRG98_024476 [Punica granatum]
MSQVAARLLLLLRPIRASLHSSLSCSKAPQFVRVQSWIKGLEAGPLARPAAFGHRFLGRRSFDTRNFCRRGGKVGVGSAFGASVIVGIVTFLPEVTYSFDDEHEEWVGASDEEYDQKVFWTFAGKIWLPVIFTLTVLLNLDHPMQLVLKVILFLFSTRPSPSSVYLFIEQMRCRSMLREPHISRFKSLYASKVEICDYKLLCLARVDMRGQKLTLVGILGGWWKLSLSPGNGSCLVSKLYQRLSQ